jgi:hypothetical protein
MIAAYNQFHVDVARVAERHGADAIMVDIWGGPQEMWKRADIWDPLLTTLRRDFSGQIWASATARPCPHPPGQFPLWTKTDAILTGAWLLLYVASLKPHCTPPGRFDEGTRDAPPDPVTETLSERIESSMSWLDQMHADYRRTLIFRDFYTCGLDGVSWKDPSVCGQGPSAVVDNQELVDTFEALMRTVGQRADVGLFMWTISLGTDQGAVRSDPLQNPALAAAIANWWGP